MQANRLKQSLCERTSIISTPQEPGEGRRVKRGKHNPGVRPIWPQD